MSKLTLTRARSSNIFMWLTPSYCNWSKSFIKTNISTTSSSIFETYLKHQSDFLHINTKKLRSNYKLPAIIFTLWNLEQNIAKPSKKHVITCWWRHHHTYLETSRPSSSSTILLRCNSAAVYLIAIFFFFFFFLVICLKKEMRKSVGQLGTVD